MATFEQLAPDLALVFTADQAKNMAETVVGSAEPPVYRTIVDLTAAERLQLAKYLKWFGMEVRPLDVSKYADWPPKRVAAKLGMSRAYVESLIAQRNAVVSAVAQWGDAAFDEFHPTQPVITSVEVDQPEAGDITIHGTDLDSYGAFVTRVQLTRDGVGDVIRNQTAIRAVPPGEVTATRIILDSSIIPGRGLKPGDQIRVQADGLATPPVVPIPVEE